MSLPDDPETFRIGVLFLPPVQLLDLSPLDLFGMATQDYLTTCGLPAPLCNLGIRLVVHYIAATGPGSPLPCTPSVTLLATAGLADPAVQPGTLDLLLIPGPPPAAVPSAAAQAFIRGHAAHAATDILTICTGVFPAAHAGILDGRTVTAPRGLIPGARRRFPAVTFDATRRWVRDGNVWCSGGITNGLDLVAAYLRRRWPGPLSNVVCALADVGDRPVAYASSMGADGGWFVWQIVRSVFGARKAK